MAMLSNLQYILKHPLNRGRRLATLIRVAKWQLASRLSNKPQLFSWINGAKFWARNGETGITGNIYTGLHEFNDMSFLLHFLRADDFFADIGANVGSYSLLAGASIGTDGVAVEPVPSTHERLIQNISINQLEQKFRTPNIGVSHKVGKLNFTIGQDTVNHVVHSQTQSTPTISVPVTTLDDLLFERCPNLMKIDVEGYEAYVLSGGSKTLSNKRLNAVIMEVNESGSSYGKDDSDLFKTMSSYGFSPYQYQPETRCLTLLKDRSPSASNVIFVKDEEYVRNRLRTASAFQLFGREI